MFNATQLGHLEALLKGKAGQEDLSSITKAMGDVEETLAVVRESLPGENAMLELQARKMGSGSNIVFVRGDSCALHVID